MILLESAVFLFLYMQIKLPIQLIELEEYNFHPVISSEINDRKANWVIDTGASRTVFDKNKFNDYHLLGEEDEIHSASVSDQPISTSLAELKSIRLGKLIVSDLKVAVIDFSHINKLYLKAGGPEICGLIGSDFLTKYNAVIDFKKKILTLKY